MYYRPPYQALPMPSWYPTPRPVPVPIPGPAYPYAYPQPCLIPRLPAASAIPVSVLADVNRKAPVKSLQLIHRYSEQQRMYVYSMLLLTSETAECRAALYWVDMHPQPDLPRGYTRRGVCVVRRHMDPHLLAEHLIHKRTEWPTVKGKAVTVGDFVELVIKNRMNEFVFDAGVDEVALALGWYKKAIQLFKVEGLVEVKDGELDEWVPYATRRWW